MAVIKRDVLRHIGTNQVGGKDQIKRLCVGNTYNPDQNLYSRELAVVYTEGQEGLYFLNHDESDLIEMAPISHAEKDQIINLVDNGEVIITSGETSDPTGGQKLWIDLVGAGTPGEDTGGTPAPTFESQTSTLSFTSGGTLAATIPTFSTQTETGIYQILFQYNNEVIASAEINGYVNNRPIYISASGSDFTATIKIEIVSGAIQITPTVRQRTLSQSAYKALGNVVATDNVLYMVTNN